MATKNNRTLLAEIPTPETPAITDVPTETKSSRDNALGNTHQTLIDAVGPNPNSRILDKISTSEGVTETDIDELIEELNKAPDDNDMIKECRQRLDEAKKSSVPMSEKERMYRDIHRKFWAYVQSLPIRKVAEVSASSETDKVIKKFLENRSEPIQWISHEGSMILCSLIAISDGDGAWININQLPDEDKEIVFGFTKKPVTGFWADLDQYKNFECSIDSEEKGGGSNFTLGNRIASIPPSEATGRPVDVKIEKKGKDIIIGNQIKLEKNRMQNLVHPTDPTNNGTNRGNGFVPRQKVAGRNAYEIRADVLEMALDWAKSNGDKKMDTDDVLDIAEAFYGFVEHK